MPARWLICWRQQAWASCSGGVRGLLVDKFAFRCQVSGEQPSRLLLEGDAGDCPHRGRWASPDKLRAAGLVQEEGPGRAWVRCLLVAVPRGGADVGARVTSTPARPGRRRDLPAGVGPPGPPREDWEAGTGPWSSAGRPAGEGVLPAPPTGHPGLAQLTLQPPEDG